MCSLSADGTTLYLNAYRVHEFDWPQLLPISITPLPQLKALGQNESGEFHLQLLGRAGANYEIQASPDFQSWAAWASTNTDDRVVLTDPSPAPEGRRFYRALSH